MPQMNLYCAGGLGTNIGQHFVRYMNKTDQGFAEIKPYFIDASRSNLNTSIPDEVLYIAQVEGIELDGSGKLRASNYEALLACVEEILYKFKPTDINVVIHSASGGTGSVIGPLIVSELLNRGLPVIVINVGSTDSKIEIENTVKTLKSYDIISRKHEKPVNMYYRENSVDTSRGNVDQLVQTAIVILSSVFSGANNELDSADLKNFLDYTRVTSYTPKLSLLDFFNKEITVSKGQSIISLVTLVDEEVSSSIPMPVEYQAVGRIPEVTKKFVSVELPIHAAIVNGFFNNIVHELESKLKVFDEARRVVTEKPIAGDDVKHTREGVAL